MQTLIDKRLRKEADLLRQRAVSDVILTDVSEDLRTWLLQFPGPKDTPYEGGNFQVKLQFPEDYPNSHPYARFETNIYHPNVDLYSQEVYVEELFGNQWEASNTAKQVVEKIEAVLKQPVERSTEVAIESGGDKMAIVKCPMAWENKVIREYRENKEEFLKKAKEWTEKYAKGAKAQEAE